MLEKEIKFEPSESEEIEPPKFEIVEFHKALKNFENLIKELSPGISSHEYKLIIGDDICGRITTLVIGGLIKEIYKEDKFKPPKILFFPAGRFAQLEQNLKKITETIQKLIEKKEIEKEDKVLIVTEYMQTGESLSWLSKIIKDLGFSFDVATLGSFYQPHYYQSNYEVFEKSKIYSGGKGLFFWPLRDLAGLQREGYKVHRIKPFIPETVSKARKDILKMIDYLKQIYKKERGY